MKRGERYQQLMKIARQLISQKGGDALTMTLLSELAGVAKPVVYTHFKNSSEVIIELLNLHYEQLTASVYSKVARASSLDDYLSSLVDASFEFENESELPIRKITNGFSGDAEINEVYLRQEEKFVKHWQQLLILCGCKSGAVDLAAYAISTMISNTVYKYSLLPNQKVARDTTKRLLAAMVASVAPDAKTKFDPRKLDLPQHRAGKEIRDSSRNDSSREKDARPTRS